MDQVRERKPNGRHRRRTEELIARLNPTPAGVLGRYYNNAPPTSASAFQTSSNGWIRRRILVAIGTAPWRKCRAETAASDPSSTGEYELVSADSQLFLLLQIPGNPLKSSLKLHTETDVQVGPADGGPALSRAPPSARLSRNCVVLYRLRPPPDSRINVAHFHEWGAGPTLSQPLLP